MVHRPRLASSGARDTRIDLPHPQRPISRRGRHKRPHPSGDLAARRELPTNGVGRVPPVVSVSGARGKFDGDLPAGWQVQGIDREQRIASREMALVLLMPPGLEGLLPPQERADLLAYLKKL